MRSRSEAITGLPMVEVRNMAAAVATNTVTVLAIATPGRRQAVNLAGTVKPNYRPRHVDGINPKVRMSARGPKQTS